MQGADANSPDGEYSRASIAECLEGLNYHCDRIDNANDKIELVK